MAVAAFYVDNSLINQDFTVSGSDNEEADPKPDVLTENPQTVSLVSQGKPPSSNDAVPFPTDGTTETDIDDKTGALFSDASGGSNKTSETPVTGRCAINYYPAYICTGSKSRLAVLSYISCDF